MNPLIFVFLDGFGLGSETQDNPLYTDGIPVLEQILGQKLTYGMDIDKPGVLVKGIDATLGVEGIPQSATGQTALFTGKNAPEILGYHLPAFPNEILIEIIARNNILKMLKDFGFNVTFANAYSDNYFIRAGLRRNAHSVTTHCMLTAKLPYRTIEDLLNNNAVYWDLTREFIRDHTNSQIEPIDPFRAGEHLALISKRFDFVLFESFATDLIGHKCDLSLSMKILNQLNSFFSGILKSKNNSTNLLICSDHGNIEDLSVGSHTMNPVPFIVIGPDAAHFRNVKSIEQVTPEILSLFMKNRLYNDTAY